MDRRQAINRMGLLLGAAVSLPTASALLSGCTAPAAPYAPRSLAPESYQILGQVAEIILPETDTPGALAAGVDRFIDTLLTDYYPADESRLFLEALEGFDEGFGVEGVRFDVVSTLDEAAYLEPMTNRETGEPFDQAQFFRRLKEMVLAGYYTSEIGATQELKPNPMGPYKGDVPFAEIGRTWS